MVLTLDFICIMCYNVLVILSAFADNRLLYNTITAAIQMQYIFLYQDIIKKYQRLFYKIITASGISVICILYTKNDKGNAVIPFKYTI